MQRKSLNFARFLFARSDNDSKNIFNITLLCTIYMLDIALQTGYFETAEERDKCAKELYIALEIDNSIETIRRFFKERNIGYNFQTQKCEKFYKDSFPFDQYRMPYPYYPHFKIGVMDCLCACDDKDLSVITFESIAIMIINGENAMAKINSTIKPFLGQNKILRQFYELMRCCQCNNQNELLEQGIDIFPGKVYCDRSIMDTQGITRVRTKPRLDFDGTLTEKFLDDIDKVNQNSVLFDLTQRQKFLMNLLITGIAVGFIVGGFGLFMSVTNFIIFNGINIIAPIIAAIGFVAAIPCSVVKLRNLFYLHTCYNRFNLCANRISQQTECDVRRSFSFITRE
jgi:hypothetical protein